MLKKIFLTLFGAVLFVLPQFAMENKTISLNNKNPSSYPNKKLKCLLSIASKKYIKLAKTTKKQPSISSAIPHCSVCRTAQHKNTLYRHIKTSHPKQFLAIFSK
ncbi:MAG: hypothetical protein WDZ41_04730 [Candidatus Babeliales bacterium]